MNVIARKALVTFWRIHPSESGDGLVKPKIIKTDKEYEAVLARIDRLMSAMPGTPQAEELEIWVHLVKIYEDRFFPIDPPNPIEAIRFRMEQQDLRQSDLAPYIGSKSKVSEVLNGRRSLSLSMIRKLHDGLGIPAEILIRSPGKIAAITTRRRSRHTKASVSQKASA